jgi:hypothetical protein
MNAIKRKRINGALIRFTLRPGKKNPFRAPVPPCSVVLVKTSHGCIAPQSVRPKSPAIPANRMGMPVTDVSLSFEEK